MKQPITPAEPRFIDEQNDVIDSLPTFATRTSLRSILQANEVKTLLALEARSVASSHGKLVASETPETE
jgi:hypothetical protein